MSMEIELAKTNSQLIQYYEAEWIMKEAILNMGESIRSAPFAPIPGIPVQFCWEVWSHESFTTNHKTLTVYFKLILVRLTYLDVPTSLRMDVNVELNFGSDALMEYKDTQYEILLCHLASRTCINAKLECLKHKCFYCLYGTCYVAHMRKNPLTVKSRFKFFGHLSSPLMHSRNMSSLENLKHFMKDFSDIYNVDLLTDLTILIGDKKLRAHKYILMAHSPVMKEMLEKDFAESKTNTLTIDETDYENFDLLLKFLYSGEIEDKSWPAAKQLYILACKYDVETLQIKCSEILESQLSIDNLCDSLKFAYDYNCGEDKNELKSKAKQFAAIHFKNLVRRLDWKEIVLSHPQIGYDVIAAVYTPVIPKISISK